jgi:prevent-host-death family protein
MRIASVAEVKSQFSAFLKASEGGPVVVTRNGRPVAVIVGVQDEDEIERLLMAYSPQLRAILERSRQQFREGQWLGEEEFWSQFEETSPTKGAAKPKGKKAERTRRRT